LKKGHSNSLNELKKIFSSILEKSNPG